MRQTRKVLAYLAMILLSLNLIQHGLGQTAAGSGATITGTVVDATNAAIPNATVVLQNNVAGFSRTVQSDATGHYTFANVPSTRIDCLFRAPGSTPQTSA